MKSDHSQNILNGGASTVEHWIRTWIHNSVENYEITKRLRHQGRLIDISLWPKVVNKAAVVIGSGPTLDQYTDSTLAEKAIFHRKYITFAATSNANVIRAAGFHPDYVVIVDSNKGVRDHIKVLDPSCTVIITTPCVEPDVLRRWKGKVILFKPHQAGNDFIINILPKMYSERIEWKSKATEAQETYFAELLKIGFINVGCTPNASIEVAAYMGYDPIHLLGVDFAYVDGRARAKMFSNKDLSPVLEPPIRHLSEHVKYHNGMISNEEMAIYKSNLLLVYYLGSPHLFIVGPKGGFSDDEIPHISWEGFINKSWDEINKFCLSEKVIQETAQRLLRENWNTDIHENPTGDFSISRIVNGSPPSSGINWEIKYHELVGVMKERDRAHEELTKTLMSKLEEKDGRIP